MIKIGIILLLIIGIGVSVFLISRQTQLSPKAAVEEQIIFPQDVIISNVTSNSLTVSYFTPNKKIPTQISYGKDAANLNQTKIDDRDEINTPGEWFSHYITLRDLEPDTTYYIKIETHGENLKHDYVEQKTAPIVASAPPTTPNFTGTVPRTSRFGYLDTLIYLKTEKGQLLSTRPSPNGSWTFDLSQYKTRNLDNYYKILPIDMVDMVGVIGIDGVANMKIYAYGLDKPISLRLGLVKIPFYGVELGSSIYNDPAEGSDSAAADGRREGGIIESIWLFITSWFGWK